jgi:hypothetical protein
MVWTHPPDTSEAPTGTILDAAYVVWQRLISQTQISRSATRSKSSFRILKPAPSNCFAGSFPLLIQFRIVLVETFRYPAAPCTVRGSSPSARFNSRRSSSGSDVSIIKISPTIFIISPLADKVMTRGRLTHRSKFRFLFSARELSGAAYGLRTSPERHDANRSGARVWAPSAAVLRAR